MVCEDGSGYTLYSESTAEFKAFPPLSKTPEGFEKISSNEDFAIYKKIISTYPSSAKFTLISENNGVKRYSIDVDIPTCDEAFVNINYSGNKARLYINGTLEDDDFYTGKGWATGLKRYGFVKNFEVEIYPIKQTDKIYLEFPPEYENGVACGIDSANVSCEYTTKSSILILIAAKFKYFLGQQ